MLWVSSPMVHCGTLGNCIHDCKFSYGDSAVLHRMSGPSCQLKTRLSSRDVYFSFRNSWKHDTWTETLILRNSSFFSNLQKLFG